MRAKTCFIALVCVGGTLGCGSKNEPTGGPAATTAVDGVQPTALAGYRVHLDLLALAHLADVDQQGLYIDFGSPARLKYTTGGWKTGWLDDDDSGSATFTYVGTAGRVYFNVDEPGALTLRMRLRPMGTGVVTPYFNGQTLPSVRLEQGVGFRDYDVAVPVENVRRGENNLLLRFGGSSTVGGREVSAAVDSIRVVRGAIPNGTYDAPNLVRSTQVSSQRALTVAAPSTISYYVEVPAGAKLGFSVVAEGGGQSVTGKIRLTPEGGEPADLWSEPIGAGWRAAAVSLEAYAGKVVRLDFTATGQATRVDWVWPSVMIPPAASREQPPAAKNVVVLLVDTQRADRIHTFDPSTRVRTPVIDQLAQEGAIFLNAQAPENWTKPSVASVLTGLYPVTHDTKREDARLPANALMISEHFKANGFTTGGFIANGYVSDRFGFDQGWDHYTNYIRENRGTGAPLVFREAADWIAAHREQRFFVYIQTIEPHVPYDPPADYLALYDNREYDGIISPRLTPRQLEDAKANPPRIRFTESDKRRLRGLYDGEVTYHDFSLGEFVERLRGLGVWDDTVFVLTSDHGEEFDDHGSWGHGHTVYQELLHVPLLFRAPGIVPSGLRIEPTVGTVSIAQTVSTLAGIPVPPAAEGVDLTTYMNGDVPAMPSAAFSDFLDDRRAVLAAGWKLILRGTNSTLFHVADDPGERTELDRSAHPVAMRYTRILLGQFLGASNKAQWTAARPAAPATQLRSEGAQMDDAIRAQLRALGYAN